MSDQKVIKIRTTHTYFYAIFCLAEKKTYSLQQQQQHDMIML